MRAERTLLLGTLSGVGAGALWGLVFLTPEIAGDFTPLQLTAGRYLAYGLLALALLLPRWRSVAAAVGRAEWIALVWLSLLGNIIYYVFVAAAVQMAGIAASTLIVGAVPVVVTLVASRESDAVPLRALLPSLALAMAGVGLIGWESLNTGRPNVEAWQQVVGILCAFGALASWSAFAIWNSRWLVRLSHVSSHDWSLLTGVVTGALALVLAVPAFALNAGEHVSADWVRFWGVAFAVGLGASVVGNGLWNRASRLLPLTMVGQMIIFETLFALVYGFLWEQRWPTALEVIACALLVAGVLWCARSHGRPKQPGRVVTEQGVEA